MAEVPSNEDFKLISKGLYDTLCVNIGPECLIKLRRQRWDIFESFASCDGCTAKFARRIPSGSMAEGFCFKTSDEDYMCIYNDVAVLNRRFCHMWNTTGFSTVFVMETEDVSPGFTLLRCLKYDFRKLTYRHIGTNAYYSSKISRDAFSPGYISSHHGPCRSYQYFGVEYDVAYTLQCPVWPTEAISFINRSLRNGWPTFNVLTNICKDGCLLVPISSKQQTCSILIELEWRISFSLAERKLICSMNHCQFLCYGLMKIFLNEVLKKIPETGELLCSYFLKTAVFWEISECSNDWTKFNFMAKFWNAFKRIMKLISIGYCPNFFIPQHNMFYGEIYGSQQRHLMLRLSSLYNEGYKCLLRCTSLHNQLSIIINHPFAVVFLPTIENSSSLPADMEKQKVIFIGDNFGRFPMTARVPDLVKILHNIISLLPSADEVTSASVELRINAILQKTAWKLYLSQKCTLTNRIKYSNIKTSQSILRKTKSKHCLSKFFLAVCSYENGEYNKTIEIANLIKQRLQRQPYMYEWNLDGDFILHCRQRGMSYEKIFKTFIVCPFTYDSEMSISELYWEINTLYENTRRNTLFMSPLVFVNFLLILCYIRISKTYKSSGILNELETLCTYDNGHHIGFRRMATSWEILGICQQLLGKYHDAYRSFTKALNDKYNYFKQATLVRILVVVFHLIKTK